jgi:signal peptidase
MKADEEGRLFLQDVFFSIATVFVVALVLFVATGLWPPLVAIESGSMEPNIQQGDLVVVTEPGNVPPGGTHGDGVVTYETGAETGYRMFGAYGSVVIFDPPARNGPPIIHRMRFWVEEGENWYDEADKRYVDAEDCEELANCPAPHDGFVTKGDSNPRYDQAADIVSPVKPAWITGTAEARVPYLGCVRLEFAGTSCDLQLSDQLGYVVVQPPSTVKTPPVQYAEASLAR